MNAKEFYEKFIAAMREENIATNEQIKKHLDQVGWTYKKIYRECESAFTELVNKGIVDRIIESEDGLIPQHEYLRIDSIGYKHRYTEISEEEAKKKVKPIELDEISGLILIIFGTLLWGYGSYLFV